LFTFSNFEVSEIDQRNIEEADFEENWATEDRRIGISERFDGGPRGAAPKAWIRGGFWKMAIPSGGFGEGGGIDGKGSGLPVFGFSKGTKGKATVSRFCDFVILRNVCGWVTF
jgi:hypothetical protein